MPTQDPHVARRWFEAADRAVLGTTDETGAPHLVPVTFAVPDDRVVFAVDHKPKRTQRLRRFDHIAGQPRVCFLIDRYDPDWTRLWWVRVDAEAEIRPPGADPAAVAALVEKYPQYQEVRPTGVVVSARILAVSGWSAEVGPPD